MLFHPPPMTAMGTSWSWTPVHWVQFCCVNHLHTDNVS